MKPSETYWPAAGNLSLFSRHWQPAGETKAVVCLVHGLGEHSGRYQHVATALTTAGYALLAIDQRGHGKSDGPRGHATYEMLLNDIELLLENAVHLYPGRPHFLYGHSMGGNLVINYTLRRRPSLTGVIATSPWLELAAQTPPALAALVRVLNRLQPARTIPNGLKTTDLSRDPAVVQAYAADPFVHNRISVSLLLNMVEAGQWALAHAAEFPLPLLLMHGSHDHITSPTASGRFAQQAPNTTFKLWDNLYHETHNEPEQQAVLASILSWLHPRTFVPSEERRS
jgi:alpha-beta hydrolase superfamily lysophospholipase